MNRLHVLFSELKSAFVPEFQGINFKPQKQGFNGERLHSSCRHATTSTGMRASWLCLCLNLQRDQQDLGMRMSDEDGLKTS